MGPSRPPINNPQTKIETMTVIGCSPTDFPTMRGKSVGLHPMTVIVSIFVWGLLIGGLLGPILAVPLTATIKVLLARYVWGERLRGEAFEAIEEVPVVAEEEAEAERRRALEPYSI